ncbi:MAG TPA: LytTR family DNA-binding domain-containing protein [Mucilaginibacter sp.]|jgi:DNA-binding LytR/AlgR family response regulator
MNCLIVDDELPARELLEDNIRQVPYLDLIGYARSASEAVEILNRYKIELMFLDIQMPGTTGLEFLKSLKNPPMVILVTAYEEHALEGFDIGVVDYLVKPVPFPRFLKAVQKAQHEHQLTKFAAITEHKESEHVFVNANYSLVKVLIHEIMFIEGMKDYVRLNLSSGKIIVTRLSLKSVEERLNSSKFMRIHKSYLIALDKIDKIQKTQLIIQDNEIPIGEGYRQSLQNYITGKNL